MVGWVLTGMLVVVPYLLRNLEASPTIDDIERLRFRASEVALLGRPS